MSKLTSCNFCNLKNYKTEYKDKLKISKRWDNINKCFWTELHVDGKFISALMKVSDHCVC